MGLPAATAAAAAKSAILAVSAAVDVFSLKKKLLNLTATSFSSPRFMPPILSLFASLFYTIQPLHSIFSDFVESTE